MGVCCAGATCLFHLLSASAPHRRRRRRRLRPNVKRRHERVSKVLRPLDDGLLLFLLRLLHTVIHTQSRVVRAYSTHSHTLQLACTATVRVLSAGSRTTVFRALIVRV